MGGNPHDDLRLEIVWHPFRVELNFSFLTHFTHFMRFYYRKFDVPKDTLRLYLVVVETGTRAAWVYT